MNLKEVIASKNPQLSQCSVSFLFNLEFQDRVEYDHQCTPFEQIVNLRTLALVAPKQDLHLLQKMFLCRSNGVHNMSKANVKFE